METNSNATVVLSPAEAHHKKATVAMILSIIGLGLFVLPGLNLAGLVLSIIGFVKSTKNRSFAHENGLTEDHPNSAGYICGLIGIIAGGLSVLAVIVAVTLFIVLGITAITMAGPSIGAAITESAPFIEDALENAMPGVMSAIAPFLAAL